jgi:hypothetical protein
MESAVVLIQQGGDRREPPYGVSIRKYAVCLQPMPL